MDSNKEGMKFVENQFDPSFGSETLTVVLSN